MLSRRGFVATALGARSVQLVWTRPGCVVSRSE